MQSLRSGDGGFKSIVREIGRVWQSWKKSALKIRGDMFAGVDSGIIPPAKLAILGIKKYL